MEGESSSRVSLCLNQFKGSLNLSALDTSSENNSALTLVYKRRKFQKEPSVCFLNRISADISVEKNGLVYQRRKPLNRVTYFPSRISEKKMLNDQLNDTTCATFLGTKSPTMDMKKCVGHEALNESEVARSSMSTVLCSDEPVLKHSATVDGLVEVHDANGKDKGDKILEIHSVNDSCSSSMAHTNAGSASLKLDVDEYGECSSSGVFTGDSVADDLSEKDLCISILRSNGLLSCLQPNRSSNCGEDVASCSGVSPSLSCNICSHNEYAEKMLICDQCEKAFHVSCCNPSTRKIYADVWFCVSCFRKKHKILREGTQGRSKIIKSDANLRTAATKDKTSAVVLMLQDKEPYNSGVRLGKAFQAVVPDWSGPVIEKCKIFQEPCELDPSDIKCSPVSRAGMLTRSDAIGNWLQCRDVIIGGENDGTICGKWRRAPLFAVQTDKWDCFSSVLWDPSHADCSVPQELETEEVMKQLKYVEMLRPRMAAKRQRNKAAAVAGNHSARPVEDVTKCTTSGTNLVKI